MSSTVRLVVAVAAVLAFFAVSRAWESRILTDDSISNGLRGAGAGLGLLLLGSYLFGLLSKKVKLPKLSGYLIFGMLVGPSALAMVTKGQLEYLRLVNGLAISVIALTAGGEIDLQALRARFGAIASVALSVAACAGLGVFALAATAPGWFGFEGGSWEQSAVAAAALLGTLSIANSPAVLVALMSEQGGDGPMAQTALAATVLKDLVLVTLFAIVFAWAGPVLGGGHGDHGGAVTATLVREIGGSVVFGAAAGVLMALYLHRSGANLAVFVVMSGFGISLLCEALGLEPLLAGLTAGLLMRNLWAQEAEPLFEAIEHLSLPVYCVFFSVAGAKLELARLPEVGVAAAILVVTRAALTYGGVRLGAKIGSLDAGSRRRLWTAFMPQAGVVLALASIVNESLEGQAMGERFFMVVVVAMGVHEIIGPVLLRWGLDGDGDQEDLSSDAQPASGTEESS